MANTKNCSEMQRKCRIQRGEGTEGRLGRAGEARAAAEASGGGRQRGARARHLGLSREEARERQGRPAGPARQAEGTQPPACCSDRQALSLRMPLPGAPHSLGLQASSSARDTQPPHSFLRGNLLLPAPLAARPFFHCLPSRHDWSHDSG